MKIFGLFSLVAGITVTPTQKVIQLLNDMHEKGVKEKQDEEVRFTTFTQWCNDTAEAREKAVKKGTTRMEQLSNAIQKANADATQLGNKIAQLHENIGKWEAEKKAANQIREKERSDYQATHTDYSESLDALSRAITTLKAQPVDHAQAESMLQVVATHKLTSHVDRRAIVSFLQSKSFSAQDPDFLNRAAPEAHGYSNQSGGVIDMLEQLKDKFTEEKRGLEREEADKKHASEMLCQTLTDQIENATSESNDRQQDKAGREADAAEAQKDLSETTVVRNEDQKYWDDLKAECRQKTVDYENRQKLRGEELEAIQKATEIISSTAVSGSADKHLPSLIQTKKTSFLLLRSETVHLAAHEHSDAVLEFLSQKSAATNSQLLSLLVTKIKANPFVKVKKMIRDMIIHLQEEATEETEHKGWCDTELATNKVTRDAKTEDVEKLTARRNKLTSRIAKLTQGIADLTEAIAEIDAAVAEATQLRNEEKEKNVATIKDAQEAQVAVSEALKVLRAFYDKAATATSLVQAPAGDAPETFDEAYTGQQDSSTGVIGLLEVIHSDFARLESETTSSEDAANREYKEFMSDSEVDRATKAQQSENKSKAKTQAESSLNATKKDLTGTQEELDAAMAYYEKLRPSCVDSGITYEERVAKREEEIQSLKEALEIVTGNE